MTNRRCFGPVFAALLTVLSGCGAAGASNDSADLHGAGAGAPATPVQTGAPASGGSAPGAPTGPGTASPILPSCAADPSAVEPIDDHVVRIAHTIDPVYAPGKSAFAILHGGCAFFMRKQLEAVSTGGGSLVAIGPRLVAEPWGVTMFGSTFFYLDDSFDHPGLGAMPLGGPSTLLIPFDTTTRRLAFHDPVIVDGTYAYVTTQTDEEDDGTRVVRRAPIAGGPFEAWLENGERMEGQDSEAFFMSRRHVPAEVEIAPGTFGHDGPYTTTLVRRPKDGSAPSDLFTVEDYNPIFALDGERAYLSTIDSVVGAPKHGGATTTFVTTNQPTAIAGNVDGTFIVVSAFDDMGIATSSELVRHRADGPSEHVAWLSEGFVPIAADDSGLYWMDVHATCTQSHTASGEGGSFTVCDAGTTETSVFRAKWPR